ncbi:HAD family hydrolase [Demequina sp.]|uniref:HAD family hydrolase n=1 Tax=Demequina sp. TaxID=2050685 RepID=UPI003D0C99E5
MIRAVLFDVDDTLVDTRGAFRHALTTVAAHYLTNVPSPEELTHTWRTDAGGHYRAHTRGEIGYREQRMRRANELHAIYGGPTMDDDAYDAWNDDFERAFQEGWRAHDDAKACLDELDARGIAYGALSNAAVAYQELKLAACGLERVPMLVGVDTLGYGKPAPEVFALACEKLGHAPQHTAYVGDELDIDAVAAAQAGLTGIWLDRIGDHAVGHPGHVIKVTSLTELRHATTK